MASNFEQHVRQQNIMKKSIQIKIERLKVKATPVGPKLNIETMFSVQKKWYVPLILTFIHTVVGLG